MDCSFEGQASMKNKRFCEDLQKGELIHPSLLARTLTIYLTLSLGVFQRSLTLILLQKYHDTNGSRTVIQSGGVYATFCQEESILLQDYRDRNGRCIVILFKNMWVRDRFALLIFLCTIFMLGRDCLRALFRK